MSPATSRHRPAVLQAAVEVLAAQGARGLTHGAVDDHAGLPKGSTSNYYRTRDALLGGVLDHILEQDRRRTVELADSELSDAATLTTALAALADRQCGRDRELTLARYAVFLEAAVHPALAERVAAARHALNRMIDALLTRAGALDPAGGQRIAATMDGYILGRVSHGAITASAEDILRPVVASAFDDGGAEPSSIR